MREMKGGLRIMLRKRHIRLVALLLFLVVFLTAINSVAHAKPDHPAIDISNRFLSPYKSTLELIPPDGKVCSGAQKTGVGQKSNVKVESLASMPVHFIKNEGQVNREAIAYAKMKGYTLWVTKNALLFDATSPDKKERDVVGMKLVGINPDSSVEMSKPLMGKVNYLTGNDPAKWRRGITTFQEIVYKEVYPNIDLRIFSKDGKMEYDFTVRPDGDIGRIKFAQEGGTGDTKITETGDIELKTSVIQLIQKKPSIYQVLDNQKVVIDGGFVRDKEGHFSFQVAGYQKEHDLIIDPAVDLKFSTYLGGTGYDSANSIAVDSNGNVYITGQTQSADFPVGQPHNGSYQGGYDVFVNKLSTDGQILIYSTYFGGEADEQPKGIAVNSSGEAFIAGYTKSVDFPIVNGPYAYLNSPYVVSEAFLVRLGADGKNILYSTVLGDSSGNGVVATAIALDKDGYAYITGDKDVQWTGGYGYVPFPEKNSIQSCPDSRLFMAKFDTSKSGDASLVFSTCFASANYPSNPAPYSANAIAVDDANNIYIAGYLLAPNHPTTANAYSQDCGSFPMQQPMHAFLSKFEPNLSLAYSTCFGNGTTGGSSAYASGLAVKDGLAYTVGYAVGNNFPLKHAYGSPALQVNAFLSIFDTNASGEDSLVASAFVGSSVGVPGRYGDYATGVALDSQGDIYVTGYTDNPYLSVTDSFQQAYGGEPRDCFITQVSPDGRFPYYRTYLGGNADDGCTAIAADSTAGNVWVSGWTNSPNFPTASPLQGSIASSATYDSFVSKMSFGAAAKGLMITMWGPQIVSPGERVTYVVEYKNTLSFDAENVVVEVPLPASATFVTCSEGCIYRQEYEELFWKLGTVHAGEQGLVTVTLEYLWGIPPHLKTQIVGRIDASNSPVHLLSDINNYLDYIPADILSQRYLSQAEITALLGSDSNLKALYQLTLTMGFVDNGVASELHLSNGFVGTTLYLLKPNSSQLLFLRYSGGQAMAELYDLAAMSYQVLDIQGGISYDALTFQPEGWGSWAEPQGLGMQGSGSGAMASSCEDKKSLKNCMDTCYKQNMHDNGLQDMFRDIKEMKDSYTCYRCFNYNDQSECPVCLQMLNIYSVSHDPAYSQALACYQKCKQDAGAFMCTDNLSECTTGWNGFNLVRYDDLGRPRVAFKKERRCNPDTCTYDPWSDPISCGDCSSCSDGKCLQGAYTEAWLFFGDCITPEVHTAGDPNAMHGLDGDVVPGQALNFEIDCENVGQGTAYGVFITDKLDSNLDEATLVINNGGQYSTSSRMITWDVGTLDPNGTGTYKGSVSYSVNVKSNVSSGTEIINMARVYFPSVPEITPTNAVVNRVYALAAHPQKLAVVSGVQLPVTLTGLDAGGASLTYRIVTVPMYGTLTGTPPDVTYTSMSNFSGLDKFSFVVSNGLTDSQPADITIIVTPSPADTTPPTVVSTNPVNDAVNVPVSLSPIAENAYPPVIWARFSEPVDSTTVTADTFTVSGLTGTVTYDVPTWTACFTPAVPLAHATAYTATLTTGIRDMAGNPMAAAYAWQFTTNNSVQVKALLAPPEATAYDFGSVVVGASSESKIVAVTSAGTANLVLGTLAFTGTGKDHFMFDGDNCSGKTLAPGQDCTVRVAFKPLSEGVKNTVLSIPSNDPDGNPKNIPLSGTGLLADISVGPSSYDFGTVSIGSTSAAVPFTISSTGTGNLLITSIGVTGGDSTMFNVTPGTCPSLLTPTIPKGTNCTVLVSFTPGSPGLGETTLRISSNDLDPPSLDIPLIGRGGKLTFASDEGTLGTQFVVTGTDFGLKKGKVLIGGAAVKVMEWDNAHIKCLLSKAPQTGPGLYNAVVQIKDPKSTAAITEVEAFTVKASEITTANSHGASLAEVTLDGNFFGAKKGKVALDIGGKLKSCKVTYWWMDATSGVSQVKFIVPKGLGAATYPLKLINKLGTATIDFKVD